MNRLKPEFTLPRNLWVQRFIAMLDAIALGFVVDRLAPTPLYGIGVALAGLIAFPLVIRNMPVSERIFKLDHEAALVLRTVLLSIFFFVLCAVGAFLILSEKF